MDNENSEKETYVGMTNDQKDSAETDVNIDVQDCKTDSIEESLNQKKKIKKPGIVYLSYVPRYMTVQKVREYFSEFGEVKRIFLKPDKGNKPGKPKMFFTEGWIEFAKKKSARQVADFLNGKQVGGKRHSPYYDALWNVKYLPKFQWNQIHETEIYQKARKQQRMRAEIAKVKREVNFYTRSVEKMKIRKRKHEEVKSEELEKRANTFKNVQTVAKDIAHTNISPENRQTQLLKKIFGDSITKS